MQTRPHPPSRTEPAPENAKARLVYGAVLLAFLAAFAALALLQYRMPYAFGNQAVATNPGGAGHWQRLLHLSVAPLSVAAFSRSLQIALTAAWLSYGLLLLAACRLPQGPPRIAPLLAAVLILTALFFPPTFSADSYLYSGYGRTQVLYHANPYLVGSQIWERHHDAVVAVFRAPHSTAPWRFFWREPSIYGPVWTIVEAVSALLIRPLGIFGQVIFFKLFAAACIYALALLVRRMGASQIAEAGDAAASRPRPIAPSVAALAIGLNPGLLVEGAGNGHNDMAVAACVVAFFLYSARRRPGIAGLILGLTIAIKLFPLALLPWGLADIWRDDAGRLALSPAAPRMKRSALFLAAALLPTIVGYAFYWHGLQTFQVVGTYLHSIKHAPPLSTLLIYAALSAWVALRRDAALPVWAILGVWLGIWAQWPWYLCWGMAASLVRMDTLSQRIALMIAVIMLMNMLHTYALL